MRRRIVCLLGLTTAFAVAVAVIATGGERYATAKTVCAENLSSVASSSCAVPPSFVPEAGLRPTDLPRRKFAPVGLLAAGQIRYGSESTALREITIETDRHGAIDDEGLPACQRRRVERLGVDAARRACAGSLVGTGTANFWIGSESVSAPLSLFKGSTREERSSKLLVQAALPFPFAPIVSAMSITPLPKGLYGTKATLPIPPIDEGRGELNHFTIDLHRLIRFNGTKESYAMARCPTGSLTARIGVAFTNGLKLISTVQLPCTVRTVGSEGMGRPR